MSVITPYKSLSAYGYSLGTGLGKGLEALAQHKLNDINKQKMQELFQQNNYDNPTSALLAQIYQDDPKNFSKILSELGGVSQQQAQPGQEQKPISLQQALSSNKSGSDQFEKQKEQLKPIINNLKESKRTLLEMKDLLEHGDVSIGALTDLARLAPGGIGNKFLNADTGAFDALSNEYATTEQSLMPGNKNVTQLKAIQAGKPSLERTKEQNLQIINSKLNKIDRKEKQFVKDYPFASDSFSKNETDLNIEKILSKPEQNYPDVSKYKEGSIINNGQIRIKKVNGAWKEL